MILTHPDTQILHTLMLDFSMTPESRHLQARQRQDRNRQADKSHLPSVVHLL